MMATFEEQFQEKFPSFQGETFWFGQGAIEIYTRCLDRQRVKEVFNTWFPNHDSICNRARKNIEKELGLEEKNDDAP